MSINMRVCLNHHQDTLCEVLLYQATCLHSFLTNNNHFVVYTWVGAYYITFNIIISIIIISRVVLEYKRVLLIA